MILKAFDIISYDISEVRYFDYIERFDTTVHPTRKLKTSCSSFVLIAPSFFVRAYAPPSFVRNITYGTKQQQKLGEKWSRGRLAACLVTRELALNAPFLVQLHIEHLIPKLFHVMLDSRLETRTRAAETLKICLKNFYTWPATNLSAL